MFTIKGVRWRIGFAKTLFQNNCTDQGTLSNSLTQRTWSEKSANPKSEEKILKRKYELHGNKKKINKPPGNCDLQFPNCRFWFEYFLHNLHPSGHARKENRLIISFPMAGCCVKLVKFNWAAQSCLMSMYCNLII